MSGTPPLQRYTAAPVPLRSGRLGRVTKASALDVIATPPAVLTYPVVDQQGDFVEPAGIDWGEFDRLGRVTNYEHGPPVGTGTLVVKALPGPAGDLIDLPVGTTTFFQSAADLRGLDLPRYDARGRRVGDYRPDTCLRYADEVASLVASGDIDGVSIEFRPAGVLGKAYTPRGPYSSALGRKPFHFHETLGMGWATCLRPVNDAARFLQVDAEFAARAEKAFKLVYESGGRLDQLPLIRKAFRPLADLTRTPPRGRVTAAVRRPPTMAATKPLKRLTKADGYDDEVMDPMADPMADEVPDPVAEEVTPAVPDMKPTPAALFQVAQGLMDLCDQADAMAEAGEHVKGLKLLKKHCEQLRAVAAKIKADGDMVAADVGGGEMADDYDTPVDADPIETDDETGVIESKSFGSWRPARVVFEKGGRRFRVSDLRPPVGKKAAPPKGFVPEAEVEWTLTRIDELEAQLTAAGIRPR